MRRRGAVRPFGGSRYGRWTCGRERCGLGRHGRRQVSAYPNDAGLRGRPRFERKPRSWNVICTRTWSAIKSGCDRDPACDCKHCGESRKSHRDCSLPDRSGGQRESARETSESRTRCKRTRSRATSRFERICAESRPTRRMATCMGRSGYRRNDVRALRAHNLPIILRTDQAERCSISAIRPLRTGD